MNEKVLILRVAFLVLGAVGLVLLAKRKNRCPWFWGAVRALSGAIASILLGKVYHEFLAGSPIRTCPECPCPTKHYVEIETIEGVRVEDAVGEDVNGGSNADDNWVACGKSLNALLGRMSLKEKIQVILHQKGQFKCPNGETKKVTIAKPKVEAPDRDRFSQIVQNLKQRGNAKPGTVPKLVGGVQLRHHTMARLPIVGIDRRRAEQQP